MSPAAEVPVIPCFGIKCEQHQNCRAYEAVEYAETDLRIGFCAQDETGARTRFIPITPAAAAAA